MQRSLREVLADSHVAVATVAILLFWCLVLVFRAVLGPLYEVAVFIIWTVSVGSSPYRPFSELNGFRLLTSLIDLSIACFYFFSAWLLTRKTYRLNPFELLTAYARRLKGNAPKAKESPS